VVVIVFLTAGFGSAASLGGILPQAIGAGGTAIPACDTAFSVTSTTAHGNVTAVTVGDVADPACEGGELSLTVTNAAGSVIASGGPVTVPADGDTSPDSVAVPVAPNPAAEAVAEIAISVVGP
jgi:hypothetical protein